jgi:hypothetical protein
MPFAPITIPEGASCWDMVALKGKSDIGDQINKRIIAPLAMPISSQTSRTSITPQSLVVARRWWTASPT